MIEALVALAVLSFGLLGVAAMQLKALQSAHAGYQRSAASLAAQDAQERLWAALSRNNGACPTPSEVNGTEANDWQPKWIELLPGLDARPVSVNPNSALEDCEFLIKVVWTEERFDENFEGFKYVVKLPRDI